MEKSNNIPLECVTANPCGAFKACIPMVNSFQKCFFPCSHHLAPLLFSLSVILRYGPGGTTVRIQTHCHLFYTEKCIPLYPSSSLSWSFPFTASLPLAPVGPAAAWQDGAPAWVPRQPALSSHFWFGFVFFYSRSDSLRNPPSQKADSHDSMK